MKLPRIDTVMIFLLFLSWSSMLFAQENTATTVPTSPAPTSASPRVKSDRKQSINFEDELVEGSAQKPELFYLFQKKNFNYKRLIKLRENFLPEMRRTTEDIQRLRGGR